MIDTRDTHWGSMIALVNPPNIEKSICRQIFRGYSGRMTYASANSEGVSHSKKREANAGVERGFCMSVYLIVVGDGLPGELHGS
jgi:hypothetical protein